MPTALSLVMIIGLQIHWAIPAIRSSVSQKMLGQRVLLLPHCCKGKTLIRLSQTKLGPNIYGQPPSCPTKKNTAEQNSSLYLPSTILAIFRYHRVSRGFPAFSCVHGQSNSQLKDTDGARCGHLPLRFWALWGVYSCSCPGCCCSW